MRALVALYFTFLFLFAAPLLAQEDRSNDDTLKRLYNAGEYDTIIEEYTNRAEQLDAYALYYLVFANLAKENYKAGLALIDLSLKKDDTLPYSYGIKGDILNLLQREKEAIIAYKKVVELAPDDFDNYLKLGTAYGLMGAYKQGIEVFKKTLATLTPDMKEYGVAFYNIGLFESMLGNYKNAIPYFEYLTQQNPRDYLAQSKLIQAYYHQEEYKKAEPLKQAIYKAHADSLLIDTEMEDMFCIEQFEVDGQRVLVFERYQDGHSSRIYNKHCFYVLKPDGEQNFRVQTEYSPFSEDGRMLYFLCATFSERSRSNLGITFGENYAYKSVKIEASKAIKRLLKNNKK